MQVRDHIDAVIGLDIAGCQLRSRIENFLAEDLFLSVSGTCVQHPNAVGQFCEGMLGDEPTYVVTIILPIESRGQCRFHSSEGMSF